MKIDYYLDQLLASKFALPIAITLVALAIILIINWRKLRHQWLEWSTRRCLNQIGIKQMKNVVWPDGLDGSFKIERIAMLHDSILLLAFKPYSGNIYCSDSIPEWTQVIGQKSYKFTNPLFELENQVTTIQSLMPNVPIRGALFFDHSAKFPKGHPDKVLNPDNIPEYMLRLKCPEPGSGILESWESLLEMSKQLNHSILLQK